MRRFRLLIAAVPLMFSGCSAGAASFDQAPLRSRAPAARTADTGTLAQRLLAAHNLHRSAAGVPLLRWDDQLVAGARTYAAQMASTGQLAHSPRQSRVGQGENLWMGTAGSYTPEAMVQSWANERRYFRAGIFPNVSSTGNWADVAHYTQMIWRSTTRIGCAVQRSGRWDYMVCRYSPAGNRDGQPVP